MKRSVEERNILDRFCQEFCDVLSQHAQYIIVSGFVAIATGRTRGTEDIDLILERIPLERWILLHNDLQKHGFVCMQSDNPQEIFQQYLLANLSVRYTWKDVPLPEMEVKFSKDVLDELQLKTRIQLPETNLSVYFSSIEMNIAFKEEYLKSDKDMEDARHLRIVFSEKINEKKINTYKYMIRRIRL